MSADPYYIKWFCFMLIQEYKVKKFINPAVKMSVKDTQ